MQVALPAPNEVVGHLIAGLDRPGPPLAVLDPAWPPALRDAALEDLDHATGAGTIAGGDIALFTSGSSGRPKAVVRTLESWRASLAPLSELTGIGPDDVAWLPLPLTSGLSLYGAFHATWAGAAIDTSATLPAAATVAHVVPAVLQQICRSLQAGTPTSLRCVVVAGAALPVASRSLAESLGLQVFEYYGAAELSFVGWRNETGPMTAFPGVDVRLVDGVLWARSPYLCRGYLDKAPHAALRWDDDWATVGDLAVATGHGGWQIAGRGDAAITTGANTVVAEEVEAALAELPGVVDAGVVGVGHARLGQVVVAVVVLAPPNQPPSQPPGRQAFDAFARRLPVPARPRRWYVASALPRTATGKLARAELADLVAGLALLS